MISSDKGLVGANPLGDVVERHKKYGEFTERLDIIVLTQRGRRFQKISDKVRAYPTNSLSKLNYYWDGLRAARDLGKGTKYDLIVTQDPFLTGLIGKRLKKEFGAKLLVHFHGDFKLNFWIKAVVKSADGIRVMSLGQKDRLLLGGIIEPKIRVISTPIDLERFQDFPLARPENAELIQHLIESAGGKKMILMVGRKDKVKDFETLFQAMRIIKEKEGRDRVGLRLAGNYHTSQLPKDLADCVSGIGGVNAADLPAYYYSSHITVLSSRSESFGKVLVEANACGRPVVATATTGAKEIIKDGYNGFLVPIGDARALAEKILKLLKDDKLRASMGENGRKLVREKFGGNLEKVIAFWNDIVGGRL